MNEPQLHTQAADPALFLDLETTGGPRDELEGGNVENGESTDSEDDEVDLEEMNDEGEVDAVGEEGVDDENMIIAASENTDPNIPLRKSRSPTCPLDVPFSVVRRIMKGAAPNKRFTPELVAAFARGAGTFGLYLLSACQEAASEADRSTIRPLEVVNGLIACGFPELAEEARVTLKIAVKQKPKSKKNASYRKKN